MENSLKDLFSQFPANSKIWLYQTNRELSKEEMHQLGEKLEDFAKNWSAHGNQLWASAQVLNPYFSVIAVNDALVPPSGCSVDASVSRIKEIGQEMNIDFFNRMNITIKEGEEIKQIHFSELVNHKEALIYDPLVSNLNELRSEWPRPIAKSSFAHMVSA